MTHVKRALAALAVAAAVVCGAAAPALADNHISSPPQNQFGLR